MTYYVGLDVALRSVAVCIIDGSGKIVLERSLACEVDTIGAFLRKFSHPIERIGFEAGAMSQVLYFGLKEQGFDIVCMEARQVSAALSAMRNKTDRNDARGIAQLLRSGWFNPVHMKSHGSHLQRALLASRKAILKKCIDLTNEVRGLFKVFGIRLPSRVSHGSFDSIAWDIIEADEDLSHVLLPMLEARLVLFRTYLELDRRVKRMAIDDDVCKRLMTVPGVGPILAVTFKAAVDTPDRFSKSRNVAAHFGLTPRRFQSGEVDNTGHISKAGDAEVRAALYSAANALLMRSMKWTAIKAWGTRLMKTKGRRRAVVAVARKLAVILHRMWTDGADFRWNGVEVTA